METAVSYRVLGLFALGGLSITVAHTLFLDYLGEAMAAAICELSTILASMTSFYCSLKVLRRHLRVVGGVLESTWFFMSYGLGIWTVAEITFGLSRMLGGTASEFTLADVLWIAGYFLVAYSLYRLARPIQIMTRGSYLSRRIKLAYLLSAYLGGSLLILSLYRLESAAPSIEGLDMFNLFYVALDAVLLTLSLQATIFFYYSNIWKSFLVFSLGMMLLAVGDLPYFVIGGYFPCNILDLLYSYSYLLIGLGLYIYNIQQVIL